MESKAVFFCNKSIEVTTKKIEIEGKHVLEEFGAEYAGPRKLELTIGEFKQLSFLSIRNTWIPDISDEVMETGGLDRLEVLRLQMNPKLTRLSEKFGVLQRLKHLEIDSCSGLVVMPVLKSKVLHQLTVSNCSLETIDLSHLEGLHRLSLAGNKMKTLPKTLQCCTRLVSLNMTDNYLETLSGSLNALTKLKVVKLNSNRLTDIEPAFCHTISLSLEILSLDNNFLTSVPSDFKRLENLQCLSLKQNQILSVPDELLYELMNLNQLFLDGNPLDDAVFGGGIHSGNKIVDYGRCGERDLTSNPKAEKLLREIERGYLESM